MTRGWRRSRWVRAAAALPAIGALPVGRLETLVQRVLTVYHLALGLRLRVWAWLCAGLRRAAGPGPLLGRVAAWARFAGQPSLLGAVLGVGRAARPGHGSRTELAQASALPLVREPSDRPEPVPVAIYASSVGNFFHTELADLLAHGLQSSGLFTAERCDETTAPVRDAREHIVVAPHEFFALGGGMRISASEGRSFRRRCTLLLAEQPGTKHFAACLPDAAEAKLVLDLNFQSIELLRRAGLPAVFFPLGYDPDFEPFAPDRPLPVDHGGPGMSFAGVAEADPACWQTRPVELLFTGVLTRRRAAFFAEHARFFAARRCFLSLPTPHAPLWDGVPSALGTETATALSQRSRILLNIHRDTLAYFEWHRVVIRGFWQKTLVVGEPSLCPPGIEPGVHLLEAELRHIPDLLRWLLDTEEGRKTADTVRRAAFEQLVARYDLREWSGELYRLYTARRNP